MELQLLHEPAMPAAAKKAVQKKIED